MIQPTASIDLTSSNNVLLQKIDILLTLPELCAIFCFVIQEFNRKMWIRLFASTQLWLQNWTQQKRCSKNVGCCQTAKEHKRVNTYTEIGGYSLSPHVGGLFRVTHHLHGVHLNTNIHNEHAAFINRPDSGRQHHRQMQQIQMRCSLFATWRPLWAL